jgi:hypothetical protein
MATCPVSGAKRNTQLILAQAGEHGSLTIKRALHSVDLPKKVFQFSGHPATPDQDYHTLYRAAFGILNLNLNFY